MNRKVLLGLFIVLGIGFFLFHKTKKTSIASEVDLASSSQIPKQKNNLKEESASEVLSEENRKATNQVETLKSGKYAIQISKAAHVLEDEIIKRDQYLNQNKSGFAFNSNDQTFVVMKLRASKEKANSVRDRSLGHEMFPIDAQSAQKIIVDDESYPVVYRESNGRVGLLTGIILVQTHEKNEAEKLALKYPMDLQVYDSSIGLATFKVRSGEGLYEIFDHIKRNERIRSVSLEVLDSYKGF